MNSIKCIDLTKYHPSEGMKPLFEFSLQEVQAKDDIEDLAIAAQIEVDRYGGYFPDLSDEIEAALQDKPPALDDHVLAIFDEENQELVFLFNFSTGINVYAATFKSRIDSFIFDPVTKH